MSERTYNSETTDARFRVQYPHISGHYAVIDTAPHGSLVALGNEEHALGAVEALNAATNPAIDEVDAVIALRDVNPAHRWRVMGYLTTLVRREIREGAEPQLDTSSLDALDDETAHLITDALMAAVYPRPTENDLNLLGVDLLENPNDALKMVPDEQKWRVSLTLARLLRQSQSH